MVTLRSSLDIHINIKLKKRQRFPTTHTNNVCKKHHTHLFTVKSKYKVGIIRVFWNSMVIKTCRFLLKKKVYHKTFASPKPVNLTYRILTYVKTFLFILTNAINSIHGYRYIRNHCRQIYCWHLKLTLI